MSPSSITLFFLIPLLLPHSEPGYDRWRGELSVGCVWWLLWYCLNLLFSLHKMIWNLNSTRTLVSVPEGFRAWNHFALCPRLSLSWSDVSEARGSPGSTLGAPRSFPPSPLPWHGPFCSTPSAFISASPSPRQCSPRWLLSLLPNLSSPSSPLSLEVLGTKLPSALSKVVLCPGRSQRFGMNHRPLSSPGPLLHAPGWAARDSFIKSHYGHYLPRLPHGFACCSNETLAVKFPLTMLGDLRLSSLEGKLPHDFYMYFYRPLTSSLRLHAEWCIAYRDESNTCFPHLILFPKCSNIKACNIGVYFPVVNILR